MIKTADNENRRVFSKYQGIYKRISKLSECFYHRKDECKGKIKQTHSLQKNRRLSIIEGEVNGSQVLYTFTEFVPDEKSLFSDLKPIGKKEASTFFGFCDYHDTVLFSPIENFPFDGSPKHCFLHSYRAFAHSYHRKKEAIIALSKKSQYSGLLSLPGDGFVDIALEGNKMGLNDLSPIKEKLDMLIENESYRNVEYFTYTKKGLYPIACSSIITPITSYRNKPINWHMNPFQPYSFLMLTVLPDIESSIVILACFPEDKKALMLINELKNLKNSVREQAISSLMIAFAENTFLSPLLWKRLGHSGRSQLLKELNLNLSPNNKFFHSKINFFDSRFSVKNIKK